MQTPDKLLLCRIMQVLAPLITRLVEAFKGGILVSFGLTSVSSLRHRRRTDRRGRGDLAGWIGGWLGGRLAGWLS